MLWRCPACAALEARQAELDESDTKRRPGVTVALLPRETVAKLEADW